MYIGLIFTRGPLWKEQRKFVCNWLKVIGVTKFGDKKNNLQLLISDAVSTTISVILENIIDNLETLSIIYLYIVIDFFCFRNYDRRIIFQLIRENFFL